MQKVIKILSGFAIVFGIVTIFSGGRVILLPEMPAGVLPFVVWFNFLAGFAYCLVGIFFLTNHRLAFYGAAGIAILTLGAGLYYAAQAYSGTEVLTRTGLALGFRFIFWAFMTALAAPGTSSLRTAQ